MNLLEKKKALIFGVANPQSIAFGIGKAFSEQGAVLAFSVENEILLDLVKLIAQDLGTNLVFKCDVTKPEDISKLKQEIKEKWGNFDILVHSIAFAPKETFEKELFLVSKEDFLKSMEISVYSLIYLTKEFLPLMNEGSILTLSFYGSEKVFPHYNLMGPVKAALETTVKYLAYEIGKEGHRINCISPGPISTLAASAIHGFSKVLEIARKTSPLKKNINLEDIGNLAVFLASPLSKSITGEIIFVDSGYNIMGINL